MNTKNKAVEMRTSKHTTDPGALQKGEDFVKAFSLGFDGMLLLVPGELDLGDYVLTLLVAVDDAIALLRLDVSPLFLGPILHSLNSQF
jgi:hypothetical protein